MKRLILTTLILLFLFISLNALAQNNETEIYFFYSKSCPHCAREKAFLEKLEKEHKLKINYLSISKNASLLEEFYNKKDVPQKVQGWVPITFINDNYFLGFDKDVAQKIESRVKNELGDLTQEDKVTLPFIGEINPGDYSLPILAIILGFFDGFNFCSLGALVLILGLVLALRERKKILIYGSVFILTTAVIYGFLIVLWYQLFSFFASYLRVMEIVIGLLGVIGSIYFLKQFLKFRKHDPSCEIEGGITDKFSSRVKDSLKDSKSVFLVGLSILLFAAVITIVEFPCSAVLPVFFAGVLAKANLSTFSYLLYIAIFVFFYMLDEIIVFLIAFFTMTIKITSNRFLTWITLLEAIILLGLGIYYLFGFGVLI